METSSGPAKINYAELIVMLIIFMPVWIYFGWIAFLYALFCMTVAYIIAAMSHQ